MSLCKKELDGFLTCLNIYEVMYGKKIPYNTKNLEEAGHPNTYAPLPLPLQEEHNNPPHSVLFSQVSQASHHAPESIRRHHRRFLRSSASLDRPSLRSTPPTGSTGALPSSSQANLLQPPCSSNPGAAAVAVAAVAAALFLCRAISITSARRRAQFLFRGSFLSISLMQAACSFRPRHGFPSYSNALKEGFSFRKEVVVL